VWLVSMAIFIASSLMQGSLNYIVTVINREQQKVSMIPLTVWAFFVTAIIDYVVSFPVLLSAALLLIFDRSFGTSFFLI
jgi:cytochrome c oxidase subunit 1